MSNDKSRDALSEARQFHKEIILLKLLILGLHLDISSMWFIALILLVGAVDGGSVSCQRIGHRRIMSGVRVGVILACIIVALGLLYATHQGKGFVRLLERLRESSYVV